MLSTLIRISVWRANPQDLPASYAWLGAILLAHVGADVLGLIDVLPLRDSIDAAALDTALLAIVTGLLLGWHGKSARLPQTLIALAGVSVILSLPAYVAQRYVGEPFATMVGIGIMLWVLAMYTHVLRQALSASALKSAVLALFYLFASVVVSGLYLVPPEV